MKHANIFLSIAILIFCVSVSSASDGSLVRGGMNIDWITLGTSNFTGYGTTANTAAAGNDARLSDNRTPLNHSILAHSGYGNMVLQNSSSVSITGGTIGGTTNFNLISPTYFSDGTKSVIFNINVSDNDAVQNDVFDVTAYNNNPEGSDHYTTVYRCEAYAIGGGAVDGSQCFAGVAWTDGTARAKSVHGTAANYGTTGSNAIAGVIGQVFPNNNTNSANSLQAVCSGDYGSSSSATAKCNGLEFGISTNGYFKRGITSQVPYSLAFLNVDNTGGLSTANYVSFNDANSYPLHIVDSRGYIAIGTTNYQINGTYPMNTPAGAIDINASVPDDPIADTWIARVSGSKNKNVKSNVSKSETRYLNQTKKWFASTWTRKATVTDGEVISELGIRKQEITPSQAFELIPGTRTIDTATYTVTQIHTINGDVITTKTPKTNYTTTYENVGDGTVREVRTPIYKNILTGNFSKRMKEKVTFDDMTGKFYQEVPYTSSEIETKRQELIIKKSKLPKFNMTRVGGLIDDPNVPEEYIIRNEAGEILGYDLEAFTLGLQETVRELAIQVDDLQAQIDELKKGKP